MNPQRFDRFSQPQFLQHVGRERVTALLAPFADELRRHGILLPALPDETFFFVLATLPRQAAQLSARLLEAMTAVEVIEEVFPDELTASPAVPAAPLVVSELRLRVRLGAKGPSILLKPAKEIEPLDCGMTGFADCSIDAVAGQPVE